MTTDDKQLLDNVLRIARAAGDAIMEIYEREDFSVETKADHSPLTAADRAAHELICAELARLTPTTPVWSEESAAIPFEERSQWTEFWLVDPLDGTKEFIKRNGEFTVNIALIRDHIPVLGVVRAPARDVDYYASRTAGAWRRGGNQAPEPIAVKRPAARPARVVGSRSHRGASLEHFLDCVGPHELVPMGSSLKLCLVASGEADVYPRLGPTSEWDTAAAQAVVECAGGVVVDLHGRPLRYNARAEVLNPYFVVYGDPEPDWLACADGAEG
jgi:3'(2'), 5'-bisphosphate nucleotidase